MFDKLMSMLQRGGTLTIDQMARELDTTPAMVNELIGHLARSGWLKQMGASCDAACSGCSLANDCRHLNQSRVWHIGA